MGFLGIGGSDRKTDYSNIAKDAGNLRTEIAGFRDVTRDQRNKIAGFRGGIQDFRNYRLGPQAEKLENLRTAARPNMDKLASTYTGMIDDPSKRGYDEATLQGMRGRALDVGTGTRTAFMDDQSQEIAAQGLGNTGAGLRGLAKFDLGHDKNQRAAMRDIDIAGAEAGRSDLRMALEGLNAVQGTEDKYQLGNLGLQNDQNKTELSSFDTEGRSYDLDQATLGSELGSYNSQIGTYDAEQNALAGKYQPGFWGKFGSAFAGAAGKFLGGGNISMSR